MESLRRCVECMLLLIAAGGFACGPTAFAPAEEPAVASLTGTTPHFVPPPGCELGSIASVRASGSDGNLPQNVLDGRLDTRWSAYGVGSWLIADLGSNQPVCGVAIAFYRGNLRTSPFQVLASA